MHNLPLPSHFSVKKMMLFSFYQKTIVETGKTTTISGFQTSKDLEKLGRVDFCSWSLFPADRPLHKSLRNLGLSTHPLKNKWTTFNFLYFLHKKSILTVFFVLAMWEKVFAPVKVTSFLVYRIKY